MFHQVQFAKPGVRIGSTAVDVITVQQNQPRKLQVAQKRSSDDRPANAL